VIAEDALDGADVDAVVAGESGLVGARGGTAVLAAPHELSRMIMPAASGNLAPDVEDVMPACSTKISFPG
jgi:hypothetical protein